MIGERVRLAREACRLTQIELAALSGLSQGTISELEAGRVAAPAPESIEAIARATSFPIGFFYLGPLPDLPDGHYRKLKRGTVKASKQVRAQVRQIVELVQRSEEDLRMPPVAIDAVRGDVRDLADLEENAQEVRRVMGVGSRDPIRNMTRAAERVGIVVVGLPTEMEDHDGFSAWPDYGLGGRPIIALARRRSGDRDRFTIAHELGHLVLHTVRDGVEPARAEDEANLFAGALLIPREAALEAIRPPVTLRVLMGLKATFGTSIAMGARRAFDLGLITQHHYTSLQKQLSKRGWNRAEPVDVQPESPLLITKIINLMAGEGPVSERAERVAMPLFAFRALAS